jgi:demethylmenaquinone methyltransferase / 2-methoxy-6-polyprenyl-1,4-benzoquinol methylase
MTAVSERYDRAARDYVQYWEPVLTAAARRLLDFAEPSVRAAIERAGSNGNAPARLLDIGTGAGSLALEALRRWPELEVVGADPSRGMLSVARSRAEPDWLDRLRLLNGPADRLPVPDEAVDLAVSSFVFQLVPDRPSALRETRRVLRQGGHFAFVTWIADDQPFEPTEAVDDVFDELEIDFADDPEEEVSGDFGSADAAAKQLRRAGFQDVSARQEWLEYEWDPSSFLDYKLNYAEWRTFDSLDRGTQSRLMERARQRLGELDPWAFRWRSPVVYASGTRP